MIVTRSNKRGSFMVVAMALVAMLTLSACSGAKTSPTPNPEAKTPANGEPVQIGVIYPTSGVWSTQGINSQRGAELAIEDINNAKGVLGGRKLVAVKADAGATPQTAASAARRLLEPKNLSAMVGAYLSSSTLTVTTVAEELKVPDITQSFSSQLITRGYKYTFKTTPTAEAFSESVFKYLNEMYKAISKPSPSVAIVVSDDASGQQQYAAAIKAAPEAGFDVVLKVLYPADITDTSALVARISAAKPGIILLNGPDQAEIQVVKGLRSGGVSVPIVGLGGAGVMTDTFAQNVGASVDGVLATVAWNNDLTPQAKEIGKRYMQKYGGTFMPGESGTAYVGVWLAATAIDKANSTDPEKVAEALRSLETTTGPAAIFPGGKIKFDDKGWNSLSFPLMVQYQKGVPVTVWPKEIAAAKPQL